MGIIVPELLSLQVPAKILNADLSVRRDYDETVPVLWKQSINWAPRTAQLPARIAGRSALSLYRDYATRFGKPDVLHAQSIVFGGAAAARIAERERLPLVLHEHRSAYLRGLSAGRVRLSRQVASAAQGLYAVSGELATILDSTLQMPSGSWGTIPNLVDKRFLDFPLSQPPATPFRFLHISHLGVRKRLDILLQGFAQAFGGQYDVSLTIGGDAASLPSLRGLAADYGVASQVTFLGHLDREQVRDQIDDSHAFVLSSDVETFGVVLVESMALGRPVISTRSGGPNELVTPTSGLLVDPGDASALASAMASVRHNYADYVPQEIRNECRTHFGPEAVGSLWVQAYEDALGQMPNRP